ncbi:MAG: FAD-dependent oxidoreductase, partial [Candidatus Buchananbacteria bacterium]|nr:FAD-dependent oxidoreductase [Candidatus Buchananbacteria bacterium]
MTSYQVKVLKNEKFGENTIILTTSKPAGYRFLAGQFAQLIFPQIKSADLLANWRWFSFASAPSEDSLIFCARTGLSEFKNIFANLKPGDPVEIGQALGKFILPPDNNKELVFLVGGVGIAPVRSMVLESFNLGLKNSITVFYSNRKITEAVFLDELKKISPQNIKVISTLTGEQKVYPHLSGRIDSAMIKNNLKSLDNNWYYVVGSPEFCLRMIENLKALEISE